MDNRCNLFIRRCFFNRYGNFAGGSIYSLKFKTENSCGASAPIASMLITPENSDGCLLKTENVNSNSMQATNTTESVYNLNKSTTVISTNIFQVKLEKITPESLVSIYGLLGQHIISFNSKLYPTFKIQSLQSGLYLVIITSKKGNSVEKFFLYK